MRRFPYFVSLLALILALPITLAQAQTGEPTAEPTPAPEAPPIPRIHVVEEGENLTYIGQLYGVNVAELQVINNLAEDALLFVGQELIIPGVQGETIATVYTVQVGDTLAGVAAAFNNNAASLIESNRLINPYADLLAGQSLLVISRNGSALPQPVTGRPHVVDPGETLLMIAARYHLSPASLAAANGLPFPAYVFPGQRLRIPSDEPYRNLPGGWIDVQARPWPVFQGSTIAIYADNLLEGQPLGNLAGQTLHFVPHGEGFVALVGLDAFAEPGAITLELGGSGNRPWQPFHQELRLESGDYVTQSITIPEGLSPLLNPQIRQSEDAFLDTIYSRFTESQYWEGLFQMPVTNTVVTAGYGDARSYNGEPVEIFHTGVDFAGAVGTPILAPAAGVVVLSAMLELRGLVVIIDHGLGVMSAYFHLSESFVSVGQVVIAGQRIAAGGSTGLSSGPHLHWDLRIMGVPVDGRQWTRVSFP
jgi:murein DD-endopeptidase MepM/ murein hydrolase activator NlpD